MHRSHTTTHTIENHICQGAGAAVMIDGICRLSSSLSPTRYNRFSASAFNPGVSADSYLPVSNSIFISYPSYSGAIRANAPVALTPFLHTSIKKYIAPGGTDGIAGHTARSYRMNCSSRRRGRDKRSAGKKERTDTLPCLATPFPRLEGAGLR